MGIALTIHILAVIIWVGGMFFAYMALRPAAVATLEPPQRLPLWSATFQRFFPWVWAAIILLPATGYWMILSPSAFGGFANISLYIHIMQGIGLTMIAIFLHVYFAPYRRLNRAVESGDWAGAGKQLNQIRQSVFTNLILGMITIIVATGGAYWS
ncbi:MAG: CopD family protein [Acidiferrobacterales bacterium]